MSYDPFSVLGSGGSTTTAGKGTRVTNATGGTAKSNAGRTYDPFAIDSVQAVANPDKPAKQAQPKKQVTPKPKKSLFSKAVSGAKSFGNAAISSERTVAKGVARVLPGGTNDIKAEAKQAETTNKAVAQTIKDKKSGKITADQAKKQTSLLAKNSSDTQKAQAKTIKEMPTKGQLAAGFAGTATDILTAGSYSKLKAGEKVGKAGLTPGKKLLSVFGNSKKARVAEGLTQVAGNAAAGGFNAAAEGGTQKDVINNAAVGAVFPELLRYGSSAVAKGVGKIADNTKVAQTAETARNVHTYNLLQAAQKADEPKPVTPLKAPDRAADDFTPTNIDQQAVNTIKQHMASEYKPASDHEFEKFAGEHLTNNTEKALATYQKRTQQVFGSKNIVGGDDAKYAVPGMAPDKSAHYHEPASEFVKGYYKHLLADPETTHKPVLITAGGTGAGKTSALKKYFVENGGDANDYAAIIDTNLTTTKSAISRIEPALATGREAHINFVYRDPVEAFANGVIPRAAKEGRAVTAGTHADTHANSLATIKELADKYKDDPRVHIQIIDNSRGPNNSKPVTLDFLHDKSYTKEELESKIHSLLDKHLTEGKLTNEQHTIFKGTDTPITTEPKPASEASKPLGKTRDNVSGVEQARKPETQRQPEQASQSRKLTEQKANTEPKQLTPSQTAHMPEVGGYTHSSDMAREYADAIRGMEQQVKGGQLIDDGEGGKTRISEHSKFYRAYFKENGKAPTKAAYLEEAKRQLQSGTDMFGAADDYKKLLDREAKPIPTATVSSPLLQTSGKTMTSKLAKGVEAQAIKAKLTKSLGDLPQYSKVNMKEQADHAIDLLKNDQQKAIDIALGKEAPPAHILPEAVYTAVENLALVTRDTDLLRALANSRLVSEATAMGQRIRALGERNPDSAVTAIKHVQEARQAAFERKAKTTAKKAVAQEVQAIRAAKPKVTKETFASFVDSLKC